MHGEAGRARDWRNLAWGLALALGTVLVYAGAGQLGTLSYDDPDYVTQNPHLSGGLTWEGLRWALTSRFAVNWFPLTWASHMLDHELFGEDYGRHHLTNVALHSANTLLLFVFLLRATGRRGRAAFVAAFFALHPLHVESVAWLSERKDVLSTAFGLIAANLYLRYCALPSLGRMWAVALAFAASLAAKPMLVTLPFLLLLCDFWPLARFDVRPLTAGRERLGDALRETGLPTLVREKWPLFALTLISIAITLSVQTPAVVTLEQFPLAQRIASVPLAYASYLALTLWPVDLIPVRLHPGANVSVAYGALLGLALLAWTVFLLRRAERHPAALVGWLWFVGLLVPVIGIVQVGNQLVADRYTYLSIVGLFVAVCFSGMDAIGRSRAARASAVAIGVLLLAACAAATRAQLPRWRDSVTLFAWTVEVDPSNHFAHAQLGRAYDTERGDPVRALTHYSKAASLRSYHHRLLHTFGRQRIDAGDLALAARALELEIRIAPNYPGARVEYARLLARRGEAASARREFDRALQLAPDEPRALTESGLFELKQGQLALAGERFAAAVEADPRFARAHRGLARTALARGDLAAAAASLERARKIRPGSAATRALGRAIERRRAESPE